MKAKGLVFSKLPPGWAGKAVAALGAGILAMAWPSMAPAPFSALAAEPGLHVELNKVEDAPGGCDATFLIRNRLGRTLDRFSMELALFGQDGVIKSRVLINMAPLPVDKTTIASFALSHEPCGALGRVLINAFPECRGDAGEVVDCLAGLTVSSRAGVELFK